MSRFSVAKAMVVDNLDTLVPELWGAGRKQTQMQGGRWAVANRWRNGDLAQMSVWRSGDRRGAWRDYVCGDKGDAIDLVAYALEGIVHADSRMRALEWIEQRFGIRDMAPDRRRQIEAQAKATQEANAKNAASEQNKRRDRARKAFFASSPQILGTAVETYALARGVRLADVPHLTHWFRFRADGQYWPARPRDGESNAIGLAPTFPVMISAMVDGAGTIGANHYTFLEPDGSDKLRARRRGYVDHNGKGFSSKLMFPETGGLVIRITHGPSGLSCEEAAAQGISGWQLISEGVEDGWSYAIADPELRIHAAGSLAGLLEVPDHPSAKGYLISQDNDWGKPQAQALFDQALARFRSFGKPAEPVRMPAEWGKDANDVLNWKG